MWSFVALRTSIKSIKAPEVRLTSCAKNGIST
jgi:hypothetical protein